MSQSDDMRTIRKLTKAQVIEVAGLLLHGTVADIELVIKDKNIPVIKAMIAGIALRILETKDMASFNLLLDRLIGRVKEVVDVNTNDGDSRQFRTPEQIAQRIALLKAEREKVLGYGDL